MHFWTVDEFKAFIPHVKKLPAKTELSILFWTGLRISELLSLRADDIDLEAQTLTVNKGFQVVDGKELIMDTKTPRSRWVIPLPEARDEIKRYMDALYEPQPDDRLFPYTKAPSTGRCRRRLTPPIWRKSACMISGTQMSNSRHKIFQKAEIPNIQNHYSLNFHPLY